MFREGLGHNANGRSLVMTPELFRKALGHNATGRSLVMTPELIAKIKIYANRNNRIPVYRCSNINVFRFRLLLAVCARAASIFVCFPPSFQLFVANKLPLGFFQLAREIRALS